MEESGAIKMAQLKSYIRGLFWSEKDNIYTANLNNVNDTVIAHDKSDALALKRMVAQDPNGFKDCQELINIFKGLYSYPYMYNNVENDFIDGSYNDTYSNMISYMFDDYTDSTTGEAVVDNEKAVVTLTPEVDTLVKVEFYSNDSGYDITVTLTKSDNSTESFVVPADADNPFEFFIKANTYSSVEIAWEYNETHSNTVTSYIEVNDNDGE